MTRCTPRLILIALSLALIGCAGGPPGADDDGTGDDDTSPTSDAAPPTETPDAGAPPARTYPEGPYGQTKGSVIENRKWMGYADTAADPDDDPFNEPPHEISLADFYQGNDPKSRLLVTIESAGWCGPCQEEASHLRQIATPWQPRGIHFLTGMWQNPDGSQGTLEYSKEWGTMFDQNTPIVADPDSLLGSGFGGEGIPFLILIDTKTMKILDFPWGADLPDVFEQYAD